MSQRADLLEVDWHLPSSARPKVGLGPDSGEGAASKGTRFNPIGTPALYLALMVEGMFLEMGHGLARRFEPLTVCTYDVDVTDLIDLRTEKDQLAEGISRADLACAWAYDLSNGKKPASWSLAERFISGGAAGILVPSFAVGAREDRANLVLWKWGPIFPTKSWYTILRTVCQKIRVRGVSNRQHAHR